MSGDLGKNVNRSWVSSTSTRRRASSGMLGRISLADLRAYLEENAPGFRDEDIMLNYSTVVWEYDATGEELAEREAQWARSAQRTEEWERKTLARLQEKYGANEEPA